jgi:ADP-L-glycero-D-manno-heptose 6-epimerase
MRALVTGGTGFVGSNLAARLIKEGWDVTVTGRKGEQYVQGLKKPLVLGDLGSIDWQKLGKFDVIFHQAAITDTLIADEKEMTRVNLFASKRLFEYAKESGCKKIIYASSTAVYGAGKAPYKEIDLAIPLNAYGKSKLALDEFAMKFASENPDMTIIGLRYCNVYGPGESHKGKMASMVYQMAQQMKKENPKLFKNGEQKRDYIFVDDAVWANLLCLNAKKSAVLNCGGGKARTFNDVFNIIRQITKLDRKIDYIDNPFEKSYQNFTECEMSKTKKEIGFVPKYQLETGIGKYFESGKLI